MWKVSSSFVLGNFLAAIEVVIVYASTTVNVCVCSLCFEVLCRRLLLQRLKRVRYASTGFCGVHFNWQMLLAATKLFYIWPMQFVPIAAWESNILIVLIPKSLKSHITKILTFAWYFCIWHFSNIKRFIVVAVTASGNIGTFHWGLCYDAHANAFNETIRLWL